MILEFTRRSLQPGMTALAIEGSIHCGPECARLEREVDALIAARETRVIFDMTAVTHADSAAIGSIVRCLTKLKSAGGALRIATAQPMIDYSLKMTKVDKLIEMFPTVDQAAKGFSARDASAGSQMG
jgi:anti-anti-sigma factor